MTFSKSIGECFSKYAKFSGRATRSEFWWFLLFVAIYPNVLALLGWQIEGYGFGFFLYCIASLIFLMPMLSVSVRRLHDTSKSGAWILISILPIVSLILIYWLAKKGTKNSNKFGEPAEDILLNI